MTIGAESNPGEPNFESWIAEEGSMHEIRRHIVGRALEFGDEGWLFASEFVGSYPIEREQSIIALASLMTQGYLASDLENPRLLRVTEAGLAWREAQSQSAVVPS